MTLLKNGDYVIEVFSEIMELLEKAEPDGAIDPTDCEPCMRFKVFRRLTQKGQCFLSLPGLKRRTFQLRPSNAKATRHENFFNAK